MTAIRQRRLYPVAAGLSFFLLVGMTSGCDQVRQRLTHGNAKTETGPATPPTTRDSAPSPSDKRAEPAPVQAPVPSQSPEKAPVAPAVVERYSSHHGSSGNGPVERRTSSGARP
jgi:hypothetical protein